jgi:hypothetical protein
MAAAGRLGLSSGESTEAEVTGSQRPRGYDAGLHVCKAGALPFEPHLQPILLWLFWRWGLVNYLPGWPPTVILPISASQVARIIGVIRVFVQF